MHTTQDISEARPPLLNSLELSCQRLGIKRTKIFQLLQEKKLRGVKLGSRTMIPEAELQRFVASLEASA
jgi:excisionase family DNA binding protein